MKKSKALSCGLCAVLLVLGLVGTVNAATVVLDGQTATGILNLQIGSTLYNVSFVETTPENLYGAFDDPPVFPFSLIESGIANYAVRDALNGSIATSVGPDSSNSDINYMFAFFAEEPPRGGVTYLERLGFYEFGTADWNTSLTTSGATSSGIYADFTVVPIPGAVWLLGGGLIGLLGIRRRFKN
jgi:hypothetical protein